MNGLKRFTSRLTASFDWLVQQVENHEALVSSTIQEVSHHAAKASIQVKRVERDGAQLKERLLRLRENIQLWEERAKEKKDTDSQMALQCLRRRKKLLAEASQVEVQLVEHKKVEQQLKEEVSLLREKLEELKR
ncbi:MAG: hypothetical protein KDD64_05350, partial [Bdellovibrionales bacterium]|nr:hypothetical protein [Bdellovibrionales bacterium]